MSTQPENPPAFPVYTDFDLLNEGMTLRDWFAGQALAGLLASMDESDHWPYCCANPMAAVAESAYAHAEAMLAERAKKGTL